MAAEAEFRNMMADAQSRIAALEGGVALLKTSNQAKDRQIDGAVQVLVRTTTHMTDAIRDMNKDQGKKNKLDRMAARDHITPTWSGTSDKKTSWLEFKDAVIGWTECVAPGATELMEEIERTPIGKPFIIESYLNQDQNLRDDLDRALYWYVSSKLVGAAKNRIKGAKRNEGYKMWHDLSQYGAPRSMADNAVMFTKLVNPARCSDMDELMTAMAEWEREADEYESRFEALSDTAKCAALRAMVPKYLMQSRLSGESFTSFGDLKNRLRAIGADRTIAAREANEYKPRAMKEKQGDPMDVDMNQMMQVALGLKTGECTEEDFKGMLLAFGNQQKTNHNSGGTYGWAGGAGQTLQQAQQQEWGKDQSSQRWTVKGEKPWRQQKSKGKRDPKGKSKGKGKSSQCHNCKGYGHFARECPSAKGASKGIREMAEEETQHDDDDDDWCQEADDDNHEEVPLMALWEDDSLSQVSTEYSERDANIMSITKRVGQKQYKRIEATIDSGSVDHVFPKNTLPMVEVKESNMSKKGARYRTATKDPVNNLEQQTFKCKMNEGHDRCMVVQVADIDKPLISVARLNDTGNSVEMSSKNPHITNIATGESTKLRRKGRSFVLDIWVEIPSTAQTRTASFQRR